MTCSQCKYEWCWICGRKFYNVNHSGDDWKLIHCNTFNFLPDTCCRKFSFLLFLIALIIFSPIISIAWGVGIFFKRSKIERLRYFNDSDVCFFRILINILVVIPWNTLLFVIGVVIGIALGAITMIFFIPKFIYENYKSFKIIMGYWSKKNRFRGEGPVKVDLIEAAKN
jgi:hypothetical protein